MATPKSLLPRAVNTSVGDGTVTSQVSKAKSKAQMNWKAPQLEADRIQENTTGKMGRRAYTPGGPQGS